MDQSTIPACLQIGSAGHDLSVPSTAPVSRSATPPVTHHVSPATSADEGTHIYTKNPYLSTNLERSINDWLDNMVQVKCMPVDPHAEEQRGWEGLEPYSEEMDEGLHGWTDLSGTNIKAGLSRLREGDGDGDKRMGNILVGMGMDIGGGAGHVDGMLGEKSGKGVMKGYEEWMERVGKEGAYGPLGSNRI